MILRPPISTRTDTLFPYTTLFRSLIVGVPARQIGWMSNDGERLSLPVSGDGEALCPHSGKRSEEHTYELQSLMRNLVCRLLLEKKKIHDYELYTPGLQAEHKKILTKLQQL